MSTFAPVSSERAERRRFDRLGAVIVAVWVGAMAALVMGHEAAPGDALALAPDRAPGLVEGDEWQTLYLKGERVGYVHIRTRRDNGWKIGHEIQLDLQVMKSNQRIRTKLDARLDDLLSLRGFDFTLDGGPGGQIEIQGEVKDKDVTLRIGTGGTTTTETLHLQSRPRLSLTNRALVADQGLEVGRSFQVPYFDPATMAERSATVEVIGREQVHVLGRSVEAFVLRQQVEGMTLHAWVTAAGDVLKEELPLGLVALRETEEEARFGMGLRLGGMGSAVVPEASDGRGDTDIISMTAPRLEGALPAGDPADLRRASFELDTLPDGPFVWTEGRQRLEGRVLTVEREVLPATSGRWQGSADALPPGVLAAETLVQSDHPAIVAKAREVVGDSVDAVEQVRRIVRWLLTHMEQTNVVGVPSALETLRSMRGDCNEHTTLFTAMARSLSIPTQVNVGMVHREGRFYYHAWAEVLLDGRWITVDPTWGQFPADVTHLRFVRGDLRKQLAMYSVIGRVKSLRLVAVEGGP